MYCDYIPMVMAAELKEAGMPLGCEVYTPKGERTLRSDAGLAYYESQMVPAKTYAEVFDWLLKKDIVISVIQYGSVWEGGTLLHGIISGYFYGDDWYEAADGAIFLAIEKLR